jgi:hypothetical protein
MSYTGFFLDTPYKVVDGNIVYAQDLNNPLAAISTGIASLVAAVQTGAIVATGTDTGIVNDYRVSLTAAPTSYVDGLMVWFKPAVTNTGASTLNVNSLGARSIRSSVRSALVGGELLAGFWFLLKYSSTHEMFLVVSYHGGTDISATRTLVAGDGIGVTSNETTVWVEIADDGVTTDKIADGAVTQDKISNAPDMVYNDILGGDASVSGNIITFTPCSCWDSTRSVFLETTTDKTVDFGTPTANTTYYLYAVKLTGGTCEFRKYPNSTDVDADSGITAYRLRTFWRTNGAQQVCPGKLTGNVLAFYTPYIVVGSALVLSTSGETSASGTVETDVASYFPVDNIIEIKTGAVINSSSGTASASTAVKGNLNPPIFYQETKVVLSGSIGWYASINANAYLSGFTLRV